MKRELTTDGPGGLQEAWPGQYDVFSWLDYAVTLPGLCTLISTHKADGAPNACFHAWGLLVGDDGNYSFLFANPVGGHTSENVLRDAEWVVNVPSARIMEQCYATIEHNEPGSDEISRAGLTVERAEVVGAPRVAECPVAFECRLEWHRPLADGSAWRIFCGRVVHVAVDKGVLALTPEERLAELGLMYNVRSTLDPLSGRKGGGACLAVLGDLLRRSG